MRFVPTSLTLRAALGLLALGGVVGVVSPSAAQQTPVEKPAQSARGWVGMSLHMETTVSALGGTGDTKVLVKDVREGSPAWNAGVRAGDTLLSIDGHGANEQFGGVTQTLRAGDSVTVVVLRNGVRRQMKMVAARRPSDVPDKATLSVSLGSDSMADLMFHAMDSLRLRLIQGQSGIVGVITLPSGEDVPVSGNLPAPGQILLQREGGSPTAVFGSRNGDSVTVQLLPEVRPPFSFFVFRGDRSDSLQSEMDQLNLTIRQLRAQQAARVRQLAAQAPPGRSGLPQDDPELQRLAKALEAAGHRAADLRATMQRVAREEAARNELMRRESRTQNAVTDASMEETTAFRPLAPYLLGQNRAAGAEVVNLRPELAEYFRVEGGVLVVDVPDGTPAALAGIQPGDVLIRAGDAPIRSIEDLRVGLARAGRDGLPLTLVRKGRVLEVVLPS